MEKCNGLGECAVRFVDGMINVEETLAGLRAQLEEIIDYEVNSSERISAAVHAVFDANMGKALTVPSLVNAALAFLEYTPETFAERSKEVADFVRQNTFEAEEGVEGSVGGAFKISKGKGGGVRRVCDTPPKPAKGTK